MDNFYKLPLAISPRLGGGWAVTCPLLPVLTVEAKTWDEIQPNVSRALRSVLEIYEGMEMPLPYVLHPLNSARPLSINMVVKMEAACGTMPLE